jgi:hypothetical protein
MNMIRPIVPWPALLIEDSQKILVIADLHLGFEQELAEMKIRIPSQSSKLLNKLTKLLKTVKPDTLIILGDVKHSVPIIFLQEWRDVPMFFEAIKEIVNKIQVIPGNHDGNLIPLTPGFVEILPAKGLLLEEEESIALLHGHTWPDVTLLKADYMVIAHNHPVIHIVDSTGFRIVRQVWLEAECNGQKLAHFLLKHLGIKTELPFKTLEEKFRTIPKESFKIIVMPSFNDLLGGLPINIERPENFLGPIFRCGAVDVDKGETYLLDRTFLGTIEQLRLYGKR